MASFKQVLKRAAVISAGAWLVYALSGCGGNPFTEPEDKYANGAWPPRPLPSPDGSSIVFAVQRKGVAQIARIDPDGSRLTLLTHGDRAADSPAYSPDGKHLVYSGSLGIARGLFLTVLQTGQSRQLTRPGKCLDMYPSFSPDGKRIVFARAYTHRRYSMGGWNWYEWDLCMVNADGSGEKRLTHEKFYLMTAPYVSPDSRRIVFSAVPSGTEDGGHTRAYSLQARTGKYRVITDASDICSSPSFSLDGHRIVFVSSRGSDPSDYGYEVWTMDRDGGSEIRLTRQNDSFHNPFYMPDGRSIVLAREVGNSAHNELWRMDADGKNLHRIVDQSSVSDE
ncbi:MAG TPA: hypothetical protein VGM37_02885 [Armatimonadota bacterium]|jgi:Tol biopolymer transport system component